VRRPDSVTAAKVSGWRIGCLACRRPAQDGASKRFALSRRIALSWVGSSFVEKRIMPDCPFDLLIRAVHVLSAAGRGEAGAVAVRGDRIAAVGPGLEGLARTTLELSEAFLLPGLIDLHAHPARDGSIFGVDPDEEMLPHGVTTVLSQGDAGASNWPRYREGTIEGSRTRVRLALNLSARGESSTRGCFADLESIDSESCARTIEQDTGRFIWGIAINVSHHACGATDPREVLRRALLVAERTGRPLLYGMRRPSDWPFAEQLA